MPHSLLPAMLSLLLVAVWGAAVAAAEQAPRYAAMLANGQRLEGNKFSDWHDERAMPRLDGKPLLEASAPLRWLRDRSQALSEMPAAYIEFTSGDRLPGVVVDYKSGLEDPYQPLPPHFVVRVALDFEPPNNRPVPEIRVLAQFVRRIVWQHRSRQQYSGSTALYRDGRAVEFRAIRHRAGAVHLLLEDGDREVTWSDLAEVQLGAVDPWTAWFDQLALLCPSEPTRLIEIETSTGLLGLASQARWTARFEGNSSDPDRWVHGIQPAWSLDILWIPFRTITYYRTFATHEVPLTRIAPRDVVHQRGLRGSKTLQMHRSVLGTPLRSRSLDFGFGFGASGGSELTFELHAAVRSLRAHVCIDRAAGSGGCIRPRIFAQKVGGRVLWEGPVLVGSDAVADTGQIALSELAASQQPVVLQIDAMLQGRPAGADPLDIRDHANWCDPLLELDPAAVERELHARLAARLALDRGWTAEPQSGTPAEAGLDITFHRSESIPGWFAPAVRVKERPLVLKRTMTIASDENWLVVAAVRSKQRRDETRLEVRIGGEPVGEFVVPQGQDNPHDDRPLAVSLAGLERSQPLVAEVEVRQLPNQANSAVQYRAIMIAAHLPTLVEVLEDAAAPEPIDVAEPGHAELTSDERHYGAHSLRFTPRGQFRLPLDHTVQIRERPQWGQARFIRFAVKKHGGGRIAVTLEDAQLRATEARYDLGQGEPAYGGAKRIWDNLPPDWVVITRDLFADFGNIDLRAVVVGCPDGEAALIDHVYLARNQGDFELIPAAPSPESINQRAREELIRPVAQRVQPTCVTITFADGTRSAGVLIHEEGEILTTGLAVQQPDRPCLVTLGDGTTAAARTRGVAREFNLGLVKLLAPGKHPFAQVRGSADLPQNQPYVALIPSVQPREFQPAQTELVAVRRVLPGSIWIDLVADEWLPGGPVVDRDGRLVGLQTAQSQFGGVLAGRVHDAWKELPRLRAGEVFGEWPAGMQPASDALETPK